MNVVISQSMLFPWVGLLEQIRLADTYVYYDDVQFSKGSFVNRVQVKTAQGMRWMTVPLQNLHLGQRIDEVKVAPAARWRDKHLELLKSSFQGARYFDDALELAAQVYSVEYPDVGALSRASLMSLVKYFGLETSKKFIDVKELSIEGGNSDRVLSIVKKLKGRNYITGLGALKYLEHERFYRDWILVSYMQYRCSRYPQLYGDFTPFVSGLDLVANCGKDGVRFIGSKAVDWRLLADAS